MPQEAPIPDLPPKEQVKEIKQNFSTLWGSIKKFWSQLIDLKEGLDKEGTVLFIQNNKRMRGANAWLLMCSIMIASLGLDKESPAIIIGAMLISPLMSPILGIGLSIGINDRRTLLISLQHFAISIIIALATSILYFYFTPLGEFNNEMAARTKPDFLDALVAIFGGLAGIISVSRKDISNAIPGVAIATALMPPLCVAGYGIANGQFIIFQEAIYLFFLNSFFISLATYLIVKILRFDHVAYQNKRDRNITNLIMGSIAVLIIVPSILIFGRVFAENQFQASAKKFVIDNFNEQENLLSSEAFVQDSLLIVRLFGTEIEDSEVRELQNKLNLNKYHKNTLLKLVQEDNPGTEELALLQTEFSNVKSALDKLDDIKEEKKLKTNELARANAKIEAMIPDTARLLALYRECKIIIEPLEAIAIGQVGLHSNSEYSQIPTVLVKWRKNLRSSEMKQNEDKLKEFLLQRMEWDDLIISRF